jgi:hypothetical protein
MPVAPPAEGEPAEARRDQRQRHGVGAHVARHRVHRRLGVVGAEVVLHLVGELAERHALLQRVERALDVRAMVLDLVFDFFR